MFARTRADIAVIKERDPACPSTLSALTNYPGFWAVWWHRVTHRLHKARFVWLARAISQSVRHRTGIEIHPGAVIGEGFFIDHGMGVVIGETTVIGKCVTMYQGVTLGGTGKERGKRHPTIEDNVVIGVGAVILGSITIGHGSKVGAGAVVVQEVPASCTVVGIPGRVVVREGQRVETVDLHHEDLPDPVVDMFRTLQHRMDRIEGRLLRDEGVADETGRPAFPSMTDETAEEGQPHGDPRP